MNYILNSQQKHFDLRNEIEEIYDMMLEDLEQHPQNPPDQSEDSEEDEQIIQEPIDVG